MEKFVEGIRALGIVGELEDDGKVGKVNEERLGPFGPYRIYLPMGWYRRKEFLEALGEDDNAG
jgi:hypothetical protein